MSDTARAQMSVLTDRLHQTPNAVEWAQIELTHIDANFLHVPHDLLPHFLAILGTFAAHDDDAATLRKLSHDFLSDPAVGARY